MTRLDLPMFTNGGGLLLGLVVVVLVLALGGVLAKRRACPFCGQPIERGRRFFALGAWGRVRVCGPCFEAHCVRRARRT